MEAELNRKQRTEPQNIPVYPAYPEMATHLAQLAVVAGQSVRVAKANMEMVGGDNWLRVQAIFTPIGSLLVTLGLSQVEHVGWRWNSWDEYKVAASFASIGILFYTASAAALEAKVYLMVLGLRLYNKIQREERAWKERVEGEKAEREQALRNEGAAVADARWREALRRSIETGDDPEKVHARLTEEGWLPSNI